VNAGHHGIHADLGHADLGHADLGHADPGHLGRGDLARGDLPRRFRTVTALVLVALALGAPRAAEAAKILNAQTWRPSPHSLDLFTVEGVRINHGYTATAFAMYSVAGDPLEGVVDTLGTLDILASVSLWDHVSFGIDLPLHLHRSGVAGLEGFTLGDLRLSLKGALYRPREHGVGFGVGLDIDTPTGGEDGFTADEGVVITPKLLLEGVNEWIQGVVNIGYVKRTETAVLGSTASGSVKIEDELIFKLGLGLTPGVPGMIFILEGTFASRVNRFFDDNTTRLELDGGVRYRFTNGVGVQVGGGGGVLDGYGDPSWRFFVSVGYMPAVFAPPPVYDQDGDGILDDVDACPLEPEDFDGFEDADGCPDLDNDGDGIPDSADGCPLDPEDFDGFEDSDGCPDLDNDGDGILDRDDGCPMEPEDKDGFQDEDGCPDLDNDGDGIPDTVDQCPNEPEDFDGCQDEDGCPEPGNICVTDEKLVISDKIFFQTNRAKIRDISFPLLDEIAMVINAHPEIELLEIQGHTDDRGSDRHNLKLSGDRAKAVREYLVTRGRVDPARLTARGYGETMPIDDNGTEEGRANNRRVEFMIVRRAPR
jgi:outer membrane protein OmpA-like peptidoglycan-associated protein